MAAALPVGISLAACPMGSFSVCSLRVAFAMSNAVILGVFVGFLAAIAYGVARVDMTVLPALALSLGTGLICYALVLGAFWAFLL